MSVKKWVMSDEWWKLSDEKCLPKQALIVKILYIYIYISFGELGTKNKINKKNYTSWQVWDLWIVWKNWVMKIKVMLPNECEKMSDELWVIEIEWWKNLTQTGS